MNNITESNKLLSLRLLHVPHIGICGWVEEEGVEILQGRSQDIKASELGVWFWWEPH